MNLKFEKQKLKQGFDFVIGCDEVGRGCLAGPVVASAIILPVESLKSVVGSYGGINDSKKLSAAKRAELSKFIKQNSVEWGIGEVSNHRIDEINIHQASLLAINRAVKNLLVKFCNSDASYFHIAKNDLQETKITSASSIEGMRKKIFVCIDGKFCIPKFDMKQQAIVKGDGKILSIAAASIIAKVYRDTLMARLAKKYPVYEFQKHKGYATLLHRHLVTTHGLSPIHRKSFCGKLV